MNVVYQQTCQRCHEDDGQRPGCHQQSDTHGVVFKRIDKHERHPDHDKHLRRKRDNACRHRGREYRYPKQIEQLIERQNKASVTHAKRLIQLLESL